jgi:hypothetical protein
MDDPVGWEYLGNGAVGVLMNRLPLFQVSLDLDRHKMDPISESIRMMSVRLVSCNLALHHTITSLRDPEFENKNN